MGRSSGFSQVVSKAVLGWGELGGHLNKHKKEKKNKPRKVLETEPCSCTSPGPGLGAVLVQRRDTNEPCMRDMQRGRRCHPLSARERSQTLWCHHENTPETIRWEGGMSDGPAWLWCSHCFLCCLFCHILSNWLCQPHTLKIVKMHPKGDASGEEPFSRALSRPSPPHARAHGRHRVS